VTRDSSEFFGSKSAQAVLKHGLLTRYAIYFGVRAGKATSGRVAFIDGYAGAGRYDDGSPGSPLLLASQAKRAEAFKRNVRLAFVETDAKCRTRLEASLAEHEVNADIIDPRPFEIAAPELLDHYANHAILTFVDPFGLALSSDSLVAMLGRSNRRRPIDVLYHFSLSSVARMGRAGVSDRAKFREDNARHLDNALGDIDWRTPFTASTDPTRTAIEVANTFAAKIYAMTGMRSTSIAVRQRQNQQPKYMLMLFSADPTGKAHWEFAGCAAKAHIDWLLHCDTADYDAEMAAHDSIGLLQLLPADRPSSVEISKRVTTSNDIAMYNHLRTLFEKRRAIRPIDDVPAVFGRLLGTAGPPSVRTAVKRLHAEGLVDDSGIGDFHSRTITWTGANEC